MVLARGPFAHKRGGVLVRLAAPERALLARLLDDVAGLLAEPEPTPGAGVDDDEWALLEAAFAAPPPSDPAVRRLLPDGHHDDAELAAGFRRLTEQQLRTGKRAALALAAAALRRPDPLHLSPGEASALLKGMTDVRLVIAERLGLRTDADAEALHHRVIPDDPETLTEQERSDLALATLYEALTYWQESLVGAVR